MKMNTIRTLTLMRREWLQNRWIWIVVLATLPLLVLVMLPFGDLGLSREDPAVIGQLLVLAPPVIAPLVLTVLAWCTVLFMATGLARRDQQDRSIEFWMSLPGHHREHVGAQYLMHAWAFPLGALAIGVLFGLLLAPLLLLKWGGAGALSQVPFGALLPQLVAPLMAGLLSVLLAPLWLAPVVMLLMALSAWTKRLALPLLAIAATFFANWPGTAAPFREAMRAYGTKLGELVEGPTRVFQYLISNTARPMNFGDIEGTQLAPMHLSLFAVEALRGLASPTFAVCVGVTLACVAALIVRRRRG
jgi:ABC-2 type transport system permease protein